MAKPQGQWVDVPEPEIPQGDWQEAPQFSPAMGVDYLKSKGWQEPQAIGLIANALHESGWNPSIKGDGGASLGLFQVNGPRRQGLMKFAADNGLDPYNHVTQLAYADHELRNTETKAGQALAQTNDPFEATQIVSNLFERPGKPMMESRLKHAANLVGGNAQAPVMSTQEARAAGPAFLKATEEAAGKILAGNQTAPEPDETPPNGVWKDAPPPMPEGTWQDVPEPDKGGILSNIAAGAKEAIFGKPRSVMIPEERYQQVAKEAGIDVAPGWTQPLAQTGTQLKEGLKGGAKGIVDLLGYYSDNPRSKELAKSLSDALTTNPEMLGQDLASKVLQGVGGLPPALVEYGAASLPAGPIAGFAGVEAAKARAQGGTIQDVLGKAAGGALMGGALRFTGGLPTATRMTTMGGLGAAQSALEGADSKDIIANTFLMGAMGGFGGKKGEVAPRESYADVMTKTGWGGPKTPESLTEAFMKEQASPVDLQAIKTLPMVPKTETPANELLARPASEFGYRGVAAKKYTVDGNLLGDTPQEAIDVYRKEQSRLADVGAAKDQLQSVLPKLRSGDYTEQDIKSITRYGKTTVSTGEAEGLLRELGLKSTQARNIIKETGDVDTTAGGAILYDLGQVVENARRKGLLPQLQPLEGAPLTKARRERELAAAISPQGLGEEGAINISPAALSTAAREAVQGMGAPTGEMTPLETATRNLVKYHSERAAELNRADVELERFRSSLGRMNQADYLDFLRNDVSAYQRGEGVSPRLAPLLETYDRLRAPFEAAMGEIKPDWEGQENYFRKMFRTPEEGWQTWFARNRSSIEGQKGFLNQAVLPDWATGLDRGLIPKYDNVVDLLKADLAEKYQYIAGHQYFKLLKDEGVAQFLPLGDKLPPGMGYLEDKAAKVSHYSEAAGGIVVRGNYIAPKEVAQLINGQFSPGLAGIENPLVRGGLKGLVGATNLIRQIKVAGPFHAYFTDNTFRAMMAGNVPTDLLGSVLGTEKGTGKPLMATGATLAPGSSVLAARAAKTVKETWFSGQGPDWAKDAAFNVIEGGGRLKYDPRSIFKWSDEQGNILRDAANEAWRNLKGLRIDKIAKQVLDGATGPIMKYDVPNVKITTHALLTKAPLDALRAKYEVTGIGKEARTADPANQKAFETERMRINQDAWKHIDYSFGQMVRENVMIHNVYKDILSFAMQFPTWNIGTAAEAKEAIKGTAQLVTGQPRSQLSKQAMRLATGLIIAQGLQGALTHRVMTGDWPETMKDVYMPVVNKTTGERAFFPSYLKTATAWVVKPAQSVVNMKNQVFGMLSDLYSNADFQGVRIRTPEAPVSQQLKELGQYGLGEMKPIMMGQWERGKTSLGQYGGLIGMPPAPKYLTATPLEDALYNYGREHRQTIRTREDADKSKIMYDLTDSLRLGDQKRFQSAMQQGVDTGAIRVKDMRSVLHDALMPEVVNKFQRVELRDAPGIFLKGNPQEQQMLAPFLVKKWATAQPEDKIKAMPELMKAFGGKQ